jgi:WD40 repeat protein/serine/threonine protein kinase
MSDNDLSAADPFGQIADEFAEAYRQGQRPSVEEFARRYPEHADDIRDILPALVMMENAKSTDTPRDRLPASTASGPLRQLGDYRLLREVGRGGMGVVYEAQQLSLGRHVAIKVLPAHALLDPRLLGRFQREARAAAKLHHTNIVPVFGVGEQDGLHYYVMQFIQGLGLDLVLKELRRLRQPRGKAPPTVNAGPGRRTDAARNTSAADVARGLLTVDYHQPNPTGVDSAAPEEASPVASAPSGLAVPARAGAADTSATIHLPGQTDSSSLNESGLQYWQSVARIGMQVADALAHAAQQGILHRDIKPSNLLLDGTGNVWVTDFGLAKSDDGDNLTHTGDIVGTLRYLAPERFNGQGDLRSDVYSLGLTLYELITLRPAFDDADRNRLVKQVMHDEPVRPRKLNPAVPRDLETVVLKAIAREPAHRYQTPAEMAEDLKRFTEDRPVKARRVSGVERLTRWARRNPQVAGSLAAVVVVFLTAFVLVAWSYFRAEDARGEEAKQRQQAQHREQAERWERYRANMIATGGAMQLHNVSAARTALDAAPEEHRNWEWKYFYHQLDTARTVVPIGQDLRVICLSHDRMHAAVQPAHGPAQLWNLGTRQVIATLPRRAPVLRFTFSRDGKILVYHVAGDFNLYLWDIAAGRERVVLSGCEQQATHFDFSPDCRRLVAGSDDRTARVWDTATGKQLLVLRGHEDNVQNAVFSPDGRRILSAGLFDRTARLWDAETGQPLATLRGHDHAVLSAIFNPQGDRILSVETYPSNALRLWDAAGKPLSVLRGHTNVAGEHVFSPDGSRIASGGLDWSIRLWDGRTGQPLAKLDGHRGHLQDLAFSPDGQYLVSSAQDQTTRLWDARTGTALGVLHGHTGSVSSARYTPNGGTIVTASPADGTVRLWDARAAEQNGALRGHRSFVYDVAFFPDGERVASAAWDGTVRVWEAATGRELFLLHDLSSMPGEQLILSGIAIHPGGDLAATCGREDGVRLWDLTTRKQLHHFAGLTHLDSQPTFSTRGDLFVWGTQEQVHVWDVKRSVEVAVLRGHGAFAAAFSPDDSWVALGGPDRHIRIWDVNRQTTRRVLQGHTDKVHALAVSRDGKWLASGCLDGTARLWDTNTWQEVAALKHGTHVYGVAFSPDGTRLACACGNGMIRLWDTKTHQLVAELHGHTDYVHKIAFSPDGSRLVSGSGDKTVRIWDSLSVQERTKRTRSLAPK